MVNPVICTTSGSESYRDCIALAVYFNSQATIDIMHIPLPDWPIREAVRPWKIIRGDHKKCNRKRTSHAEGKLPHFSYPPHENKDGRKSKRKTSEYQWRSGIPGNNKGWHE